MAGLAARGLAASAVALRLTQLLLNAAWTPVSFGALEIGGTLALWVAILCTVLAFMRVSRAADELE
jgi:tryptophan-rich sensory protein